MQLLHQDFVLNGSTYGPVAKQLENVNFDPGMLRPYTEDDPRSPLYGQRCVHIRTGKMVTNTRYQAGNGQPMTLPEKKSVPVRWLQRQGVNHQVWNAATALRKEEWILLDTQVLRAARYRLRAYADAAKANSFGGFNGMTKMILEHEVMSDPGQAIVDMTGLTPGRRDAPSFQLRGLPLPITHVDFDVDSRFLGISRNSGTPFDTSMGEASGRRVAEAVEKTTIGVQTGVVYGGASTYVGGYDITSQVFGYVNYPQRQTKTGLYRPTGNGRSGTGWVPADTLFDVLACIDQIRLQKFYGPWIIYHSNDWDQYLDRDYFTTTGTGGIQGLATQTLRQRLVAIGEGDGVGDGEKVIMGVRRLDFLFASTPSATTGPGGENLNGTYPFTFIFVQMTPDVMRAINGMDITTIQWEEKGGMLICFKVMCIQVPNPRSDKYGNCGILQATATV